MMSKEKTFMQLDECHISVLASWYVHSSNSYDGFKTV